MFGPCHLLVTRTKSTLTILLPSLLLWDTTSASPHCAVRGMHSWRKPRGGTNKRPKAIATVRTYCSIPYTGTKRDSIERKKLPSNSTIVIHNNLSAKEICTQQFFASSRHLVLGSQNYTEKKMFIKSNKVETLQHMQKIEKVSAQFLGKSESLESTSMINGLSKRPWCCHQTKTCVFSVRPRSLK